MSGWRWRRRLRTRDGEPASRRPDLDADRAALGADGDRTGRGPRDPNVTTPRRLSDVRTHAIGTVACGRSTAREVHVIGTFRACLTGHGVLGFPRSVIVRALTLLCIAIFLAFGLPQVWTLGAWPATSWMNIYWPGDFKTWGDIVGFLRDLRAPIPPLLSLGEILEYRYSGRLDIACGLAYRVVLLASYVSAILLSASGGGRAGAVGRRLRLDSAVGDRERPSWRTRASPGSTRARRRPSPRRYPKTARASLGDVLPTRLTAFAGCPYTRQLDGVSLRIIR